jgi:hypothetical protein
VQKFQQSVRQIPETLPSGTRADQMVTLGRLLAKNTRAKILLNIHIASMHLADLLASSDHEKVSKVRKSWGYVVSKRHCFPG